MQGIETKFKHLLTHTLKLKQQAQKQQSSVMNPKTLVTGLVVVLALYCGIDPFDQSAISKYPDFKAYKVDMPDWSLVPPARDFGDSLRQTEMRFMDQVQGHESVAFDPHSSGFYTGVTDGRVVHFDGQKWADFAYTSQKRTDICDMKQPYSGLLKNEHMCGRPMGLRFDKRSGDLYITDAYFGLMKVGPEGGLAKSLVNEAEGTPLGFTNDLDVDSEGNIYFTDSSATYHHRDLMQLAFSGENNGRVLKYNPSTSETTVLLRNLQFPRGLSVSKDSSFLVICEGSIGRLLKYYLTGDKAGTTEILAILPGYPAKIRMNENGDFWVAVDTQRSHYNHMTGLHPILRTMLLMLPIPARYQYFLHNGGRQRGLVVKYSPEGKLLKVLEDRKGKVVSGISTVEEKDGSLWMGSGQMPFVGVYSLA